MGTNNHHLETTFRIDKTAVLLLLALGAMIMCFYPGLSHVDTCVSFLENRPGSPFYQSNWQPPIIYYLVRLSDELTGGFGLFFIIQTVVFLAGSVLILSTYFNFRRAIYLTYIFILFPPIFIWLITPGKDSSALAFFLLSFGFFRLGISTPSATSRKISFLLAGWFSLVICMLFRHNSIFLALPLLAILALSFYKTRQKRALAMISFIVLLIVGHLFINQRFFPVPNHHPEQTTMIFDIAAISKQTDKMYLHVPANRQEGLFAMFKQRYSAKAVDYFYWPPTPQETMPFIFDSEQFSELTANWLTAIKDHPWIYVQHRIGNFIAMNIPCADSVMCPLFTPFSYNAYPECPQKYWFPEVTNNFAMFSAKGPLKLLFLPLAFFILGWFALAIAIRRRHLDLSFFIGAGLFNQLCYLIISPACHFRYSLPMTAISILGSLILFSKRTKTAADGGL